jgi:hypothetical protein
MTTSTPSVLLLLLLLVSMLKDGAAEEDDDGSLGWSCLRSTQRWALCREDNCLDGREDGCEHGDEGEITCPWFANLSW